MSMAEKILSESLPAEVNDRTWGVLTALSDSAKQRSQGPHIVLTAQEHVLGRAVKEAAFLFDSPSISGRHCRIFRKSEGQSVAIFIKDSSSNGTFVNGQRLRKDTPDLRIQHGDIISLAALPELAAESGFAYVFRDTSSGCLKRKQEDDTSKPDDSKRIRIGADGPVSLTDVRRLERSNQELRQKLESECYKSETLNADLRAAKSYTDNLVKEAVDRCTADYSEKLESLQMQLSAKASALDEYTAKCAQMESAIKDLQQRLTSAGLSRLEAEEALKHLKENREELEKQLEKERNQWKSDRELAELLHKAAVDRIRAEAADELKREAESFARQQKKLEDELVVLQHSKEDNRAHIDSLVKKLEEEREARLGSDKKTQELQILLNSEHRLSSVLKQELENAKNDIQNALERLDSCQGERDSANAKVEALQLEKEDVLNTLKLEKQRFEGARDRILLRETQLRAFQATAEAIESLQQKQQEQLRAMMKTLEDDDAEMANLARNQDDLDCKSEDPGGDMDLTQVEGGTQDVATLDMNEYAATQVEESPEVPTTQIVATQINHTQLQIDATQLVQDGLMEATQLAAPEETGTGDHYQSGGEGRGTTSSRRNNGDPERRGSLCTADLLASEVAGSWANEDPGEGPEVRNETVNLLSQSQVGNSDSLMVSRRSVPAFNDTMASQNSPKSNLNNVPDSEGGSDTEVEEAAED